MKGEWYNKINIKDFSTCTCTAHTHLLMLIVPLSFLMCIYLSRTENLHTSTANCKPPAWLLTASLWCWNVSFWKGRRGSFGRLKYSEDGRGVGVGVGAALLKSSCLLRLFWPCCLKISCYWVHRSEGILTQNTGASMVSPSRMYWFVFIKKLKVTKCILLELRPKKTDGPSEGMEHKRAATTIIHVNRITDETMLVKENNKGQ